LSLLKVPKPQGSTRELATAQADSIRAAFALYDDSIAGMDSVLAHRLGALNARTVMIFGSVLAVIVIAGAIMFAITRSMSTQLAGVSEAIQSIVSEDIAILTMALKRLAAGDLTGRFQSARPSLTAAGTDEVGTLVATYNSLADALTEMSFEFTMATGELHGHAANAVAVFFSGACVAPGLVRYGAAVVAIGRLCSIPSRAVVICPDSSATEIRSSVESLPLRTAVSLKTEACAMPSIRLGTY
jgi:methyl-accepting chemotaxis protein